MSTILALLLAFGGTGQGGNAKGGTVHTEASVGWYGDSLTAGACNSTPPPGVLDASLLNAGWVVLNLGVSGESAHAITRRVITGAATACGGACCGVYVVQGGVNTLKNANYDALTPAAVADLALNGNAPSCSSTNESCGVLDAWAHLATACPRAVRMAVGVTPYCGCTVDICPLPLVDCEARAIAFNTALEAACLAQGVLCVQPYEDFEDPQNAGHLLPANACADEIHFSQDGADDYAAKVHARRGWQ